MLREAACEFVTYERAPYPKLPAANFTSEVTFGEGKDAETIRFVESTRRNLKKGRGRVRRISVLDPEGHQVNILASSTLPAERLIAIMRGRWGQENAFKHGSERWGLNHLDARKVLPVDPDDIMPNPARRKRPTDPALEPRVKLWPRRCVSSEPRAGSSGLAAGHRALRRSSRRGSVGGRR